MSLLKKLQLLRINALTDQSLRSFIEDVQERRTASRKAGVRKKVLKGIRKRVKLKQPTKKQTVKKVGVKKHAKRV